LSQLTQNLIAKMWPIYGGRPASHMPKGNCAEGAAKTAKAR
jgi:hypothetical protein